jgi:hypothetical protein
MHGATRRSHSLVERGSGEFSSTERKGEAMTTTSEDGYPPLTDDDDLEPISLVYEDAYGEGELDEPAATQHEIAVEETEGVVA